MQIIGFQYDTRFSSIQLKWAIIDQKSIHGFFFFFLLDDLYGQMPINYYIHQPLNVNHLRYQLFAWFNVHLMVPSITKHIVIMQARSWGNVDLHSTTFKNCSHDMQVVMLFRWEYAQILDLTKWF